MPALFNATSRRPNKYADYCEWTNTDGCLVRIDIVAERPGPDHCGWEDADVLIVGSPLGEPYTTPSDSRHHPP